MLKTVIIGSRIETRLAELGISQTDLARNVGVTQGAISQLIAGGRGSKHIHRIARELRTTPAYLTGETDDPNSDAPDVELTPEEQRFLEMFRQLDKAGQETIRGLVDRLAPPAGRESSAGATVHSPRVGYRSGAKKK